MGKTGTKGPSAMITVVIATALIVSAAGVGFKQLWHEGVFSETKPIELTQSAPQTPSPSSPRPPQAQSSPPMTSRPQMQPSRQTPASPQQPTTQSPPQTQSTPPKTPATAEAKPDPSPSDADFQMWFQQEMDATEYEQAMLEMAETEANAPQKTPAPTEQTEPNTSQ